MIAMFLYYIDEHFFFLYVSIEVWTLKEHAQYAISHQIFAHVQEIGRASCRERVCQYV